MKRPKKGIFGIFYAWLKKFQNGPIKIKNPTTSHKFYVDLGPKRYLGPRDPIIGSMGYGGGGGSN